jgi:DNA-binding NarL/FixJ family response regulator
MGESRAALLTGAVFFGRDAELDAVESSLRASAASNTAFELLVYGDAGIGKTTLLRQSIAAAESSGWLAIYVSRHPIQETRAFSGVTDVITAILRSLGSEAARYSSGLEGVLSSINPASRLSSGSAQDSSISAAAYEIALSRLLDGVLVDRPILLAIDDYQWLDRDSDVALAYAFSLLQARPFGIVRAERRTDHGIDVRHTRRAIVLDPVTDNVGRRIVLDLVPAASNDVVDAILAHSRGIPFDIVALASQVKHDRVTSTDGIAQSIVAAISVHFSTLDTAIQDFLQICALLSEPLDLEILRRLFPSPTLENFVAVSTGRYLAEKDAALVFRHAKIAEAVRATIKAALPQRKRILDTLLSIEQPSLEILDRIVSLAKACGDSVLARSAATRMGHEAWEAGQWQIASNAFASAVAFGDPEPSDYVNFFRRYAGSLRIRDCAEEAVEVYLTAIRRAEQSPMNVSVGRLAAGLAATLCDLEDYERARATCAFYLERAEDPLERMELLLATAYAHAHSLDVDRFDEIASKLRGSDMRATAMVLATLAALEAIIAARLGEDARARRMLDSFSVYLQAERSALEHAVPWVRAYVETHHSGWQLPAPQLNALLRGNFGVGPRGEDHYFAVLLDFVTGKWEAALQKFHDVNVERLPIRDRALLLSVPAAMAAFSGLADSVVQAVPALLRQELKRGYRPSVMQLAVWWAAGAARRGKPVEPELSQYVRLYWPSAGDISLGLLPIAAALHADYARDEELLRLLAESGDKPASNWLKAQRLLAQGYAKRALRDPEGSVMLAESATQLRALSAPFFAALASSYAGTPSSEGLNLLFSLGVTPAGSKSPRKRAKVASKLGPTAREFDIAHLVADGLSNRQIAQQLFLSERTVEAHLANLYGKLSISSRVQLAQWIGRQPTPA